MLSIPCRHHWPPPGQSRAHTHPIFCAHTPQQHPRGPVPDGRHRGRRIGRWVRISGGPTPFSSGNPSTNPSLSFYPGPVLGVGRFLVICRGGWEGGIASFLGSRWSEHYFFWIFFLVLSILFFLWVLIKSHPSRTQAEVQNPRLKRPKGSGIWPHSVVEVVFK